MGLTKHNHKNKDTQYIYYPLYQDIIAGIGLKHCFPLLYTLNTFRCPICALLKEKRI